MKTPLTLKIGQKITAKRYNDLANAIVPTGIHGGNVSHISGQPVVKQKEEGFWAKVFNQYDSDDESDDTPSPNKTWKRIFPRIIDDAVVIEETDQQGDRAFAIDGRSISDGQIVYLRMVPENSGYVFGETIGGGGSGTDGSDAPPVATTCVRVMADLVCQDGTTVKQYIWIPVISDHVCPVGSDESVG